MTKRCECAKLCWLIRYKFGGMLDITIFIAFQNVGNASMQSNACNLVPNDNNNNSNIYIFAEPWHFHLILWI